MDEKSDAKIEENKELENVEQGMKENSKSCSNSPIYVQLSVNNLIVENKGVVAGDNASFEDLQLMDWSENRDTYDKVHVKDESSSRIFALDEVKTWIKAHFGKYESAMLISAAVFHDMPYIWIKTNADTLYSKLEMDEVEIESAKRKAKEDLLQEIGLISYNGYVVNNDGKVEMEFATFLDEQIPTDILKYIWNQYLDYRKILVEWVKLYAVWANVSQAKAATGALSIWAQEDFGYFEYRILDGLISEENLVFVSNMLHLVAQNPQKQEKIKKKIKHFGSLEKSKYVMLALLVGQFQKWDISPMIEKYLMKCIHEIGEIGGGEYIRNLPIMYALGQRKAFFYKAMVEALYKMRTMVDKEKLNTLFYLLLESDMKLNHMEQQILSRMILVRMLFIDNGYKQYVEWLWKSAWNDRKIGIEVKALMKQYWTEMLSEDSEKRCEMNAFYRKVCVNSKEAEVITKYIG